MYKSYTLSKNMVPSIMADMTAPDKGGMGADAVEALIAILYEYVRKNPVYTELKVVPLLKKDHEGILVPTNKKHVATKGGMVLQYMGRFIARIDVSTLITNSGAHRIAITDWRGLHSMSHSVSTNVKIIRELVSLTITGVIKLTLDTNEVTYDKRQDVAAIVTRRASKVINSLSQDREHRLNTEGPWAHVQEYVSKVTGTVCPSPDSHLTKTYPHTTYNEFCIKLLEGFVSGKVSPDIAQAIYNYAKDSGYLQKAEDVHCLRGYRLAVEAMSNGTSMGASCLGSASMTLVVEDWEGGYTIFETLTPEQATAALANVAVLKVSGADFLPLAGACSGMVAVAALATAMALSLTSNLYIVRI